MEMVTATRVVDNALNGYLPERFNQVIYMRDFIAVAKSRSRAL